VKGTGLYGVHGISENYDNAAGAGGYFESYNHGVHGVATDWTGYYTDEFGNYTYKDIAPGDYIGGYFRGYVNYNDQTPGGTGVNATGGKTGVEAAGEIYGVKGTASKGFYYYPDGGESAPDAAGVTGIGQMEAFGVYGEAETTAGVYGKGPTGVNGSGTGYDFYASGEGTDYGAFTGAHDALLSDGSGILKPGMVVSLTGEVEKQVTKSGDVSLSSTLPTVKLSEKVNDKAVFGVFVTKRTLEKEHWYSESASSVAIVNALGEGRVWVCDANGDIEAGDYITTSDVAGYGQKQGDDLLHNYTLAKATETIDWSKVSETATINGKQVKVFLLAVVYVSG
jgi:hypothetical protein